MKNTAADQAKHNEMIEAEILAEHYGINAVAAIKSKEPEIAGDWAWHAAHQGLIALEIEEAIYGSEAK